MTRPRTDTPTRLSPLDAPPSWRAGERARILPRLVPLAASELADRSREGRSRILELVARALGSERRRGRARHWSYSLDRHVGLLRAFGAEMDQWRRETGSPWWPIRRAPPARSTGRRVRTGPEDDERRGS